MTARLVERLQYSNRVLSAYNDCRVSKGSDHRVSQPLKTVRVIS